MCEVECFLLNILWTQWLVALSVNPNRVNDAIKFFCTFDQFVVGKLGTFARHVWQDAVQSITHDDDRIAPRVFRLPENFIHRESERIVKPGTAFWFFNRTNALAQGVVIRRQRRNDDLTASKGNHADAIEWTCGFNKM